MVKFVRFGTLVAYFAIVATDPAFAGAPATPGPMIGAGAPALALFGVGYWLLRRRRG